MSRLVVIADPETALGFQMAGVEVMSGDALETATAQLEQLLSDPTVGLVAVSATLIARLNDGMRRRHQE